MFREIRSEVLAAWVAERGFGLIACAAGEGAAPLTAHVPVLFEEGLLRFHLSAANPLCAQLQQGARMLAVVSGPDAYVSPDWYEAANQVPTWNYCAVEIEGVPRALDRARTVQLLDDLSAHFEARLAPKPAWTRGKMDPAVFEAMLGGIVGFEVMVERFEGTAKLSQNKPDAVIARVAAALRLRTEAGSRAVAERMSGEPPAA